MSDRAALQRRIFAACRSIGLDDEARHDLQFQVTGKRSIREMTDAEMRQLSAELNRRGGSKKRPRPAERRADQRLIWVLWRLLAEAEVVTPGADALRAFICSDNFAAKWGTNITDVRFLNVERAQDVVEALKAMAKRNGVEMKSGKA